MLQSFGNSALRRGEEVPQWVRGTREIRSGINATEHPLLLSCRRRKLVLKVPLD